MAVLSTALIVIAIILTFLSQNTSLRIRHISYYIIDIDTPLIGLTFSTEKKAVRGNAKKKGERPKNNTPALAYYNALYYLIGKSRVAVGKCFPEKGDSDSPVVLLPSYALLYSLLSLVINRADRASVAEDFAIRRSDTPNIDLALNFSLTYLIISLFILQYYKRKSLRRNGYVGK